MHILLHSSRIGVLGSASRATSGTIPDLIAMRA
jgi:hypothetical protein